MTAVIMAAGLSRRFGQDKLLMKLNNKEVVLHVLDLVLSLGFSETILVFGTDDLVEAIGNRKVKCVKNHSAAEGISTSVKCGICASSLTDAYIFFTGDQPFIDAETVNRITAAFYEKPGSIIVPRYAGRNGNPVIFPSEWRKQLENLTGDVGGRAIIKNNQDKVFFVDIIDVKAGMDIDTWEDYVLCGGGSSQ